MAAAVAAGLCPAATESDGGGSLRNTANFCGIYTIKPTQGRVSCYTGLGGPPLPNIFSQPGPMTRTVSDAAMLLQVMAGLGRWDQSSIRRTPSSRTSPSPAPSADSSYPVQCWNEAFTMHGNAIGHPAASVPTVFSPDRLPIGL